MKGVETPLLKLPKYSLFFRYYQYRIPILGCSRRFIAHKLLFKFIPYPCMTIYNFNVIRIHQNSHDSAGRNFSICCYIIRGTSTPVVSQEFHHFVLETLFPNLQIQFLLLHRLLLIFCVLLPCLLFCSSLR